MRIDGRVAVVTGSGMGIGRAVADAAGRGGRARPLRGRRRGCRRGAARAIRRAAARAEAVACDVRRPARWTRCSRARPRLGGAQALVCNAAVQYEEPVESTPPEEWDRVLSVNLQGHVPLQPRRDPQMRAHGGGSIVNMASVNGFWIEPSLAAYSAAKGGVSR